MRKLLLVIVLALLPGCGAGGLVHPENTFLKANDMIAMTNQMAASISADPRVQAAAASGPLVVVLKPARNETDTVIPQNQKALFVYRLRSLLADNPSLRGRFVFVLNKDEYQELQAEEGLSVAQLGPHEERLQPGYALSALLQSLTDVNSEKRSDAYLCTYTLTNIPTGQTLWTNHYETKKFTEKGLLD